MKVTLSFILPEQREEMNDALEGWRFKRALEEVWEQCFRPRHKHGYSEEELNKLLESEEVQKAFDLLEKIYLELRSDLEV